MLVRCINQDAWRLTYGKEYKVIGYLFDSYVVINDHGTYAHYMYTSFEEVYEIYI